MAHGAAGNRAAAKRAMPGGFAKRDDWDFQLRLALGEARAGATDAGEVLAAVDGVKTDAEWRAAWTELGRRVIASADSSLAAGHRTSAAYAYLRGSSYLARAVDAALSDGDDEGGLALYREHRAAWEAFLDHADATVERLSIPLPGSEVPIPAWFIAAGGTAPAPVMVGVNGSDGAVTSMWSAIGFGAAARGYHVLLFDGPGQQSMLFEHGIPFVADFAPALTAVVDAVAGRPDVSEVVAYGISQAGYWLPQALATEHRVAAALIDPGVVDVATSWRQHLPGSLLKAFDAGKAAEFDRDMAMGFKFQKDAAALWRFRANPYCADGPFATLAAASALNSRDALPEVTTPLWVADPEGEQFWPGQSAELAALVPGATLQAFTAAEGADGHCEPMGRALFEQRAFDWLDERLGR